MNHKNNIEVLLLLITHIKYEKLNMDSATYKNINKYYEFMYKMFDDTEDIVDFIERLIKTPVKEYVSGIVSDEPLLNTDGSLKECWNQMHTEFMLAGSSNDDNRFKQFRDACYKLQQQDAFLADNIYRETRKFIIDNPITTKEEIDFVFINTKISNTYKDYKNIALKYIKESYELIRQEKEVEVCNICGYVKRIDSTDVVHRLCHPTYNKKLLKRGQYVVKPNIFTSIIQPGRFELKVYNEIISAGFSAKLFPDIETQGDIVVAINGESIYLDMKSYFVNKNLHEELTQNGYLKDKYKNRWIIIPDDYYEDQKRELQYLLNNNGSRIYNISDLIDKLRRMEVKK